MKLQMALATLLLTLTVNAQPDAPSPEMQKRLDAYKQKMEKLTANLKATAAEYCDKKVEIACKMKNGTKATPEESYDAKEIALFKEGEAKVKTCNGNQVCKIKVSKDQMNVLIKIFNEKCSKGDTKYCFTHKIFQNVSEGTALMEKEAIWLEAHTKKK